MSQDFRPELFRIVLAGLGETVTKKSRRAVWDSIWSAHAGWPDGYLVTNDNQWLFRAYRNSISPNPDHLIDAALAYGNAVEATP